MKLGKLGRERNIVFGSENRTRVFVSVKSRRIGGGANTFASNFSDWVKCRSEGHVLERKLARADLAIVIADKVNEKELSRAKSNGCFVIHRLDEHVEEDEEGGRRIKHQAIRRINQLADVTVYQSDFVFQNMHPYLSFPPDYEIILNGGDQTKFFPAAEVGSYVGHVSWSVGGKKRLDLLYAFAKDNAAQKFLLVGNQERSKYQFGMLPNVRCVGPVRRRDLLKWLHKMKWIYFPSENDPCPNTVVEGILAGLPVCFNKDGGTRELVQGCGLPLERASEMDNGLEEMRSLALERTDLFFERAAEKYLNLYRQYSRGRS